MGLFGHGGFFSKTWHTAEKAVSDVSDIVINKPLHELNKIGEKIFGDNSWYAGYNSNSGPIFAEGEQADQIMGNGGISGSIGSDIEHASGAGTIKELENINNEAAITTGGYKYNNIGKKPNTYTGNVAKTANSIKQGGMTKDDIIAYNQKHTNEIAGTKGSTGTSLNTNRATKGY